MALVVGGNDANTVFFLPMEGDDGVSTFTNQAVGRSSAQVVSQFGARLSNAQAKFGGTSLFCDGGGARLEVSPSNAFAFAAGDWTVDFWTQVVSGDAGNMFTWYLDDDNFLGLELVSASGNFVTLQVRYRRSGVDVFVVPFSAAVGASNWRHFAVERSGTTVRAYFSGTVKGSATIAATETVYLNAWKLYIGNATRPGMVGLQRGNLYVDAFRVSNVARWSGAFSFPSNIYTATQKLTGRGGYALRAGQSANARGSQSVGMRNYPLHGRGISDVIDSTALTTRGASGVLDGHTLQGRGSHGVAKRTYDLAGRGVQSILEPGRSLAGRGESGVHSGAYSLAGRGIQSVLSARNIDGRGSFGIPVTYSWQSRGSFAVVDDTLDRIPVYYKFGSPPDPNVDAPVALYLSFPALDFELLRQEGLHYLLVRRRNKYGMESANLKMIVVELDATFHTINVRPSSPIKTAATATAAGKVRVTASYVYGRDGSLQADDWNVYTRTDGTDPDPAVDTPVVVTIVKTDGIARLTWDSAAQADGTTVKAIVRVARNVLDARDDNNTTVVSAVANVTGPSAPVVASKLNMPLP